MCVCMFKRISRLRVRAVGFTAIGPPLGFGLWTVSGFIWKTLAFASTLTAFSLPLMRLDMALEVLTWLSRRPPMLPPFAPCARPCLYGVALPQPQWAITHCIRLGQRLCPGHHSLGSRSSPGKGKDITVPTQCPDSMAGTRHSLHCPFRLRSCLALAMAGARLWRSIVVALPLVLALAVSPALALAVCLWLHAHCRRLSPRFWRRPAIRQRHRVR